MMENSLLHQLGVFLPKARKALGQIENRTNYIEKSRINLIANIEMLKHDAIKSMYLDDFRSHIKVSKRLLREIKEIEEEVCSPAGYEMLIIPGIGGEEASIFSRELSMIYDKILRIINREAPKMQSTKRGTLWLGLNKEIVERIWYDQGVHRVQRIPTTGKKDKMHTSTAMLLISPIYAYNYDIDENDFELDYARSGGPGGQHVNKTSSMVRIRHKYSDIMVRSEGSRDQEQNKQAAWELIMEKINQEIDRIVRSWNKNPSPNLDRSAKIRTYNFQADRLTDHRCGMSFSGLMNIFSDPNIFLDKIDKFSNAVKILPK